MDGQPTAKSMSFENLYVYDMHKWRQFLWQWLTTSGFHYGLYCLFNKSITASKPRQYNTA